MHALHTCVHCKQYAATHTTFPPARCCCYIGENPPPLPQTSRLALPLQQRQNVTVTNRALHVAHNRAVLVIQKLHADLANCTRGTRAAENPAKKRRRGRGRKELKTSETQKYLSTNAIRLPAVASKLLRNDTWAPQQSTPPRGPLSLGGEPQETKAGLSRPTKRERNTHLTTLAIFTLVSIV